MIFRFTPDQLVQLHNEYPTVGSQVLAERFGCTQSCIRNKASQLGIRTNHQARNGSIKASKSSSIDLSFFDSWTPESAYVLGYIWADGCIRTEDGKPSGLDFICTAEDSHILYDLRRVLKSTATVRHSPARQWFAKSGKYQGRLRTTKAIARLGICSTVLAEKLIRDHGLAPRKSTSNLPYPANVPDHLLHHFVRGNFDGDGSIHCRGPRFTVYICGSIRFIRGLVSHIKGVLPSLQKPSLSESNDGLLRATWTAKPEVLRLREWLYQDATIFLNRKRAIFEEAVRVLATVKDYRRRINSLN